MSSYTSQITDLQKRILEHMMKCDTQTETISHIANSLGLSHPTIHNSVKLLIEDDYLKSDQRYKRGRRILTLTQKGDALAVMLGSSFDELSDYIHKRRPADTGATKIYQSILSSPGARDFFFQLLMQFGLENNCFEKGGEWKNLSDEERKRLQRWSIAQYMNRSTRLSEAGKYKTKKSFIEEAGLNRKLLLQYMHQHRLLIDSMINELSDT